MRTFISVILLVVLATSASLAVSKPFIFGVNPIGGPEVGKDPALHDPMMFKAIADAGGTIVRLGFNWDQIERVKGQPKWEALDKQVEMAVDNNLAIVGLINSTPSWASPNGKDTPFYAPKMESAQDFRNFLLQLVARYKGRIKYWEFWNEANGYGWHTDKGYNLTEEYVPWLKIAYTTLKTADPTCLVGTTGLDDAGGNGHIFLTKLYQLGAKGYFDAVVDHPYSKDEFDPEKLRVLRRIMDENGDKKLPIWITEMGWNVKDSDKPYAKYITNYFNVLNSPEFNYVPIATYHTICDFSSGMLYGLMDKDLKPRDTYQAFKNYPKPARPAISSVTAKAVGKGEVVITFKTNIPSTGVILYGTTPTYGEITKREPKPVTSHEVHLKTLKLGQTYHYRVRAATDTYNFSFSKDGMFTVK